MDLIESAKANGIIRRAFSHTGLNRYRSLLSLKFVKLEVCLGEMASATASLGNLISENLVCIGALMRRFFEGTIAIMLAGQRMRTCTIASSLAIALLSCGSSTLAQPQQSTTATRYVEAKTIALKQLFQTKRDWHVTAYKPGGDDAETGELPVKICFWVDLSKRNQDCVAVGEDKYPHQNLSDLSVVSLRSNPPFLGVKIDAFFSGGGSGIAREVSISTYDTESDVFSNVATLRLNEISEYRIIDSGPLGGSIITASGIWQQDEGHFGDHKFWMQVYRYGSNYKSYEKFIGYLTQKKYSAEQLNVIKQELGSVSRIIKNAYGDKNPLND